VVTAFERIGAERLRAVVEDFIDRVVNDDMIGFFFRDVDPKRLAELEFQFAARALGAKMTYEGRPLGQAHGGHRIMGGQFARRLTLLRLTMEDHGVAADIRASWLEHSERLRPLITSQPDEVCAHLSDGGPLVSHWRPASRSEDGENGPGHSGA